MYFSDIKYRTTSSKTLLTSFRFTLRFTDSVTAPAVCICAVAFTGLLMLCDEKDSHPAVVINMFYQCYDILWQRQRKHLNTPWLSWCEMDTRAWNAVKLSWEVNEVQSQSVMNNEPIRTGSNGIHG